MDGIYILIRLVQQYMVYAANKNILEKIPIAMKNGSSVNLTIGNSMDAHSVTIRNVLSETVGSGTEYIYQVMDPLKV
jgi:hypothetical protein